MLGEERLDPPPGVGGRDRFRPHPGHPEQGAEHAGAVLRVVYEPGPAPVTPNRVLLVAASVSCVLLGPAVVTGVPPAIPSVAAAVGLRDLLVAVTLPGTSPTALYFLSCAGVLAANAVNNLPAYLALESVASDAPERLVALLVGVNAGPLVTVWGSIATLLWQQRCRSLGLTVSAGYLAREGLLCVTVVVTAALTALLLVR